MASTKRLYVGRLSYKTRERDLEDAFAKYGKVVKCDVKQGYAFVVCAQQQLYQLMLICE